MSPDTPVNTNFIIKIICSVGVTLILFSGIMITIKCFINKRNYATLDEPGILRDSAGEHILLNTLNENSSLL